MPELEAAVIRVVVDVGDQLASRLSGRVKVTSPAVTADDLLHRLGADADKLFAYLDSPDFASVATQMHLGAGLDLETEQQLREGLRLAGIPDEALPSATVTVHGVLVAASAEARSQYHRHSQVQRPDLVTSAGRTGELLRRLTSLTRFHHFAAQLRDQIVALHDRIRLPHIGVSRAVPYDHLYVRPSIDAGADLRLGRAGDRTVILGDPGAGKSTFAAKFAHDIAADDSGRVPFLVVLREFSGSFDQGGRTLVHYLEKRCQEPYNMTPPRDAVEYLLRSGRAVVVLDGLDEIVRTEARRRVVALVEGFAHLYPLVPVVVTARRIGYDEAPLDTTLFRTAHLREFSDMQVRQYVIHWFGLDDATSPAEHERLVASFMRDSEQIPDLRCNPLLLALLCAMYSSDRYLPHNLAQVYERCALMLFEQWDLRRGIPLPLKFHGRLRGAVQHLAWQLFTAPESGKALSRTRIVNALTAYLDSKLDDHDESVATAEEFLAFCTGRAWVLTDVGATDTEPQYGFTHRTFLEFFAAEHLVRTHRTAADLWAALRPNLDQWDVVARIAMQLYDRNVEDGIDELLAEAVRNGDLGFATRSLRDLQPGARTVRAITAAAVDATVFHPVEERIGATASPFADWALRDLIMEASATNLPIIERAVADCLDVLIGIGALGAALLLDTMTNRDAAAHQRWQEVRRDLIDRHHETLVDLWKSIPWCGGFTAGEPEVLREIVRHFGVQALYAWCHQFGGRYPSAAYRLLDNTGPLIPPAEGDTIAALMIRQSTPWLDRGGFVQDVPYFRLNARLDSFRILLALPFLENEGQNRNTILAQCGQDGPPPLVAEFLTRWARHEFSVLGTGRPPQRQHRAPR